MVSFFAQCFEQGAQLVPQVVLLSMVPWPTLATFHTSYRFKMLIHSLAQPLDYHNGKSLQNTSQFIHNRLHYILIFSMLVHLLHIHLPIIYILFHSNHTPSHFAHPLMHSSDFSSHSFSILLHHQTYIYS